MAKTRKPSDLPRKICATCGRPFTWRKKWARVWEEVRYCSDRCRRERPKEKASPGHGLKGNGAAAPPLD